MPNYNEQRGHHYGVFAAIHFPNLWDDILSNGKSLDVGEDEEPPDFIEEEDFAYECGTLKLETSHLGGACIVFVTDSDYITYTRECSPCVPEAGDLDNPTEPNDGFPCLCLPPDEYDGIDDAYVPYVIESISEPKRRWEKKEGKLVLCQST